MAEQTDRIAFTFDAADEYRPEAPPPPEIPAWKDGSIRIGIHTSIAGDISGSLEIAHGLGANALQIFSCIPPRSHIRGLHEKICNAFAPSPCAISSDPEMSPAMLVWIPMRMLPSFQAGISGGGGASGRYSSAASKVKAIRSVCSAIPSKVPELYPPSQEGRSCGSRTVSESPIIPPSAHRRKNFFRASRFAQISHPNPINCTCSR